MHHIQEIINSFSDVNEGFITNYHNFLFGLLVQEYEKHERKIKKEQDEEKLIDFKYEQTILKNYMNTLKNSIFFKYYSHAEEWILLKIKKSNFHDLINDDSGSIMRFKEPLRKLGVDLSKIDWCTLANAVRIRNCLAHANGRIDLISTQKKERLLPVICQYKKKGFLFEETNRLYVTGEYLNYFKKAVRNILHYHGEKLS